MKLLALILLVFPALASADCPYEIEIRGKAYCSSMEWGKGELKKRGEFAPSQETSPYLVPMGEVPSKWIFSQATISVWEKGAMGAGTVEVPDLRIFPYMFMKGGHHHSTGHEFFFDKDQSKYVLRRTAFQEMEGCWSLRWTTHQKIDLQNSHALVRLSEFTNLSEDGAAEQVGFCEMYDGDGSGGGHHGGHH